jgi:hypothetical protein
MGYPFVLVLLLVLVLDAEYGAFHITFRGWNQRVTGFPIILLLLEGLRCISRKVNSLPAKPLGGRTLSRSAFRARGRARARGITRFVASWLETAA